MSDTPEALTNTQPPPELIGGPPSDDALPGMQLGDYVVEKAVAWGGMGIVYRAVHPLIGRKVAIKVLRPNFASDPEQASRFLKEAQAISAIKHRGIIDIIGFGKLPDGRQYMVMEFLDGESLEATMQREGAMSPARALALVDEVLDALSAAHKVGVVHRDLKPANVYITLESNGSRYVKLIDFGLARRASVADLERHSGKASLMAGTPEYLSPEQAKGLAATPRTDLYCLGVMLFEMVTGRLPFIADSVIELLNLHVNQPPPRASSLVSELPRPIDDLIAQLLLKQPEQRPNSADLVRQTVQRILRQLKEDTTRVTSKPTALAAAGLPQEDDQTRLTAEKPLSDSTRRTDRAPEADTSEPTARPAKSGTDETAQGLVAVSPATQPVSAATPRWIWGAVAAGLVALGGAGWAVIRSTKPVEVVEVPPPPAESDPTPALVEEPKVFAPPVTSPGGTEPAPLTRLHPKPKPQPIPRLCEEANWRTQVRRALDSAEQDGRLHQVDVDSKLTPPARALQALNARLKTAATESDCAAVVNGVLDWRARYGVR